MSDDEFIEGSIKSWNGVWHGFLHAPDDGRDWFIHLRDNPALEGAEVGTAVRFRPGVDRQGRRCAQMAEVIE